MNKKLTRKAPSTRKFDVSNPNLNDDMEIMEQIAIDWSNKSDNANDSLEFYFDKIKEEIEEMMEGEDLTPTLSGDKLQTEGDSRFSESITVILTILHWQRKVTGYTYKKLLNMLIQRYREQAWKYEVIDSIESEININSESSFADGTYWLLRFSRDNRIFGCKTEWSNGVSRIREVADLDTSFHWDTDFVLPISYEPHMTKQNYTLLGDVRGVVFPDGNIVEFFNPRGAELITEPRDGKYVNVEDVEWRKPILGSFRSMRYP